MIEELEYNLVQNRNRNISKSTEETTMEFFSKIPKNLSLTIFKYYELDFDMFGYDKKDAMRYVDAGLSDWIFEICYKNSLYLLIINK